MAGVPSNGVAALGSPLRSSGAGAGRGKEQLLGV